MLSPKQQRFCQEWVIDHNGTQAAIRAGYSVKSAKEQSARLLTKANIQKEIARLQESIATRNTITVDQLIAEFKSIANDDITNYLDVEDLGIGLFAKLKDNFNQIPKKNIKTLRIGRKGDVTIELHSRMDALVNLGRHIGFFNDALTLKTGVEDVLKSLAGSGQLSEADLTKIAELLHERIKKDTV